MIDYIPENFIPWSLLREVYRSGMSFAELGRLVCARIGVPHAEPRRAGHALMIRYEGELRSLLPLLEFGVFLVRVEADGTVTHPDGMRVLPSYDGNML